MVVTEVKDENPVLPNRVYVIPPGQDMIVSSGRLQLSPREIHGQHRPIDLFLHSLAEERKHLVRFLHQMVVWAEAGYVRS